MRDTDERARARKQMAKEARRRAYLEAKERRAKDPAFIAMKAAVTEQRRAAQRSASKRAREQRRARAARAHTVREEARSDERSHKDAALLRLFGNPVVEPTPALVPQAAPAPVPQAAPARVPQAAPEGAGKDTERATEPQAALFGLPGRSPPRSYGPN